MAHARKTDPRTAHEAAAVATENKSKIDEQIIGLLQMAHAGLTSIELGQRFHMPIQTTSTSMSAMEREGKIELSGYARKNKHTKRFAQVYVNTGQQGEGQRAQLKMMFENGIGGIRQESEPTKLTFNAYMVLAWRGNMLGWQPEFVELTRLKANNQRTMLEAHDVPTKIVKMQKTIKASNEND